MTLFQVVPPLRVLYSDSLVATYAISGLRGCGAIATIVSLCLPQFAVIKRTATNNNRRDSTAITDSPRVQKSLH